MGKYIHHRDIKVIPGHNSVWPMPGSRELILFLMGKTHQSNFESLLLSLPIKVVLVSFL